jgi:YD repeat-containing protein
MVAGATALTGILTAEPAAGSPEGSSSSQSPIDVSPWAGELQSVPLLGSEGLVLPLPQFAVGEESAIAGVGDADAEQRARASGRPVARTEVVSERAADRQVFDLSDGTREVVLYAEPRFFQDGAGAWQPIDTSVVPDEGAADGLRSAANSWTARFLRLDPASGGVRFDSGDASVGMRPVTSASVVPERDEDDPSVVVYRGVWPEADVQYTVRTAGVEEDVVLASSKAGARFDFALSGAVAAPDGEGVRLSADGGELVMPAPTVVDATGADVSEASGVALTVGEGGTSVAIVLDDVWLAALPSSAFPLHVDPSFYQTFVGIFGGADAVSYSSLGATYTNNDVVRLGRSGSGEVWRSQVHFHYEAFLEQQAGVKYRVLGASMSLNRTVADQSTEFNGQATPYLPTAASYAGTVGRNVDIGTDVTSLTKYDPGTQWADAGFESWLSRLIDGWFDAGTANMRIGFNGDETTNGTMHSYDPSLTLHLAAPPPATTLTAPGDGQVFATRTPTLAARPVTGASEQVYYRFEVSTQRGGGAASAVSSGWTTATSWTVPDQALLDGATYYARVYTGFDVTNPDTPQEKRYTDPLPPDPATDRQFQVDLKLGAGGPAPMQAAGTVEGVTGSAAEGAPTPSTPGASISVNMVDGNAAVAVPTHSVGAVGGSIAPQLVYNSLGASSAGLVGEYYADPSGTARFDGSGVVLRAQRVDPVVDFDWRRGSSPVASIQGGGILVRWTGYLAVPTTGAWRLGFVTTDQGTAQTGARLYLNGEANPAANWWTNTTQTAQDVPVLASARQLTAGAKVPIRLELHGVVGEQAIRLIAVKDGTTYEAQPSWLTQASPTLPDGWQLSAIAGSAAWVGLTDLGDTVVLRAADGSSHEFRRISAGGYEPPAGSSDWLTIDGQGKFGLQTANGLRYTFRPDGGIEQVTTIADDRHPAAFVYTYTGSTPRLSAITDPVSGRSVNFDYGPTACTAPAGMLCRIRFWDGAVTELTYNAAGQLARVANPGYAVGSQTQPTLFDFAYDSAGRVSSVRDPLAADLVAYGVRPDDQTIVTRLGYGADGRIGTVMKPLPTVGGARPLAIYTYDTTARRTAMQLYGFTFASGYARQVGYDERGRITSETDPTGILTTTYRWDEEDRLVAKVDPTGIETSYGYDAAGRLTDTWGPAPGTDFDPDDRPLAGATVPHVTTEYDTGLTDLATAYWPNAYLAGAPTLHGTGLPEQALDHTWSTAPVTPGSDGRWTVRMTGEIAFPQAGSYTLNGESSSGDVRVWVDDTLVYQRWGGTTSGPAAIAASAPSESHRIRVEYRNPASGTARLRLQWAGPGAGSGSDAVPDSALRPRYGLPTRTTDADGVAVATEYADPATHIGPEYGLPTATIADPDGLALATRSAYEDPTAGGYLRRTGRTLPAGNTWTSSYYGGTQGPIATVCGVDSATAQAGFLKQRTGPDPTGPDGARVEQYVYDATGRVAGQRTGTTATINQAGWACTSWDGRGRTLEQTWPTHGSAAGYGVQYTYAVGGDPLTTAVIRPSTPGVEGQVVSTLDLTGHVIGYTAGGFTTTTTYDRLGRVQSSVGPVGQLAYTYRSDSGRLSAVSLDGTTLADVYYQASTGRVVYVNYANGRSVDLIYDEYGRQDGVVNDTIGDFAALPDKLVFSLGGRAVDEWYDYGVGAPVDPSPGAPGFVYDTAGRLISAVGLYGTETYSYGSSACGSAPDAGRNTNITTLTHGATASVYCYDEADRLAVGGAISSVEYDDHGDTTELNGQSYQYDAADRVVAISKGDASTSYVRDPVDRIVEQTSNGTATRLRYTGFSEDVAFTTDEDNQVVARYLPLPGNARLTIRGSAKTWSYADMHGNTVVVTDKDGWPLTSLRILTPYGAGTPATAPGDADALRPGFLGGDGKLSDTTAGLDLTVQLGERTYARSSAGSCPSTR